jgi:hypothetical protein
MNIGFPLFIHFIHSHNFQSSVYLICMTCSHPPNLIYDHMSRPVLGPTQLPIQWVPGALSLGIKRPEREVDNSPPSRAEVKNTWSSTSTSPIRLHGAVLSWSTGTNLSLRLWRFTLGGGYSNVIVTCEIVGLEISSCSFLFLFLDSFQDTKESSH